MDVRNNFIYLYRMGSKTINDMNKTVAPGPQ